MAEHWPDEIHGVLQELQVRQVAYVPDAGHRRLIERCQADMGMRAVSLTTEEEGVAQLCGAWLGGERGVLLMQSSGIGNCINMLTMNQEYRLPAFMLVTMRGEWGEFNPQQIPMGRSAQRVLESAGVEVYRADSAEMVAETVRAGGLLAFNASRAVAVLIAQRVVGTKRFN